MSDEQKPAELGKCENLNPGYWEPKTRTRFVVYIADAKTGKAIVPTYLVKYIDRLGFVLDHKMSKCWNALRIKIYDPIVPTNVLFTILQAGRLNIQVNELGPVGDVVSTWLISDCVFKRVAASPLDWSSHGEPHEITAEIDWTEIYVKGNDGDIVIKR